MPGLVSYCSGPDKAERPGKCNISFIFGPLAMRYIHGMEHRFKPRILILSESPEGFGHFNITDQLGTTLSQRGATVALASGSFDHAKVSFDFKAMQKFSLPGVYSACPEPYDIASGAPYKGALVEARQERMRAICEQFKPDIIVAELFPFKDSYRAPDLDACRAWMHARGKAVPVVSLCRDLIRSNEPQTVLQLLDKHIDRILVRGDGLFSKLEDSMPEWQGITTPIRYTGNIVSPMPARSTPASAHDPVVVFGGGGYKHHEDFPFFANAIEARAHAGPLAHAPWQLYVSAHCPPEDMQALQALAAKAAPDGSITVQRPIAHAAFQQVLSDCGGAIMRGGYNSCFELAAVQKPFISVPRNYTFSDQLPRAQRMESLGYCAFVHPEQASAEAMGQALAQQHANGPTAPPLNCTGLDGASDAIFDTIREARRLPLKAAAAQPRIHPASIRAAQEQQQQQGNLTRGA
jgi:predicted glycosyltransferase